MPASRPDVEYAPPKPRLVDRLRNAALKPADPEATAQSRGAYELSGQELEIEEKRANDKERAIGLLAGPLATLIAFLVIHQLVVNDPSARLSDGAVNKLHVSLSTYRTCSSCSSSCRSGSRPWPCGESASSSAS